MAAGLVQVTIKDGGGTSRNMWFWSDDGLITGNLQALHVPMNSAGAVAAFGSGVNGATVPRYTLATDDGLHTKVGEVQASPTANTMLGRLKSVEDKLDTLHTDLGNYEYETVAASQTAQVLGATGASGDYIAQVLVIPATTSPGAVTLLDNATSITIFTGGTNSVSNLVPFTIALGMRSVSGAWKLTTGANVSCIGIGDFT